MMIKEMRVNGGRGCYLDMIEAELARFLSSRRREEMITAKRYYAGEHDVLRRHKTAIGADGKPEVLDNVACSRIAVGQYARLVDQKINYSLGKPFSIDCDNKRFASLLASFFEHTAKKIWRDTATDAVNCGVAWLHPYIDKSGMLTLRRFDPTMCLPLWSDAAHTRLDAFIRLCTREVYSNRRRSVEESVFVYTKSGIEEYAYSNGRLRPVSRVGYHFCDSNGKGYLWDRVPIIPVKYNSSEVPLIRRAKNLQDALDILVSDFADNMQENSRSTVLVLKNYDGEDLGEFRRNLAAYGAVKVRSDAGGDGGVESLAVEVKAENYEALKKMLMQALTECCRGFDSHDGRLSNNPNQMNVLAIYSDIDLDANGFESELQCAFESWFGYIRSYLYYTGAGDFRGVAAKVVLNRDLLINESEIINSLKNSEGILSRRILIAQHPYVDDIEGELARLELN